MKVFGALFAIMNPFAGLPMFLGLTAGTDDATRRREALGVVLYSTILCAVIVAAGSHVLGFFGIGVADFRVAGGIVLLMIALALLNGGSSAHSGSADERAARAPGPRWRSPWRWSWAFWRPCSFLPTRSGIICRRRCGWSWCG